MNTLLKQLSHRVDKQHLTPVFIFGLLALVVWNGGAYFAPLAQPEKRFYTIIALLLSWILVATIRQGQSQRETKRLLITNNPELAKKLQALTVRFQNAVQFLKKTTVSQRGQQSPLAQLPWYLFIGTPHSGKTTFLANANTPFVLARKFKHQNLHAIPASETCDWWVTQDVVMVDVPGAYIHSRLKQAANTDDNEHPNHSPHHILWKRFLALLKQHRGKHAITGVVIALPLPELIAQQTHGKEQLFIELKQRCAELCAMFGTKLSFHLVITKCDLLPGFVEFFNDSGADELAQAWGIKLPGSQPKDSFIETLITRFNALIKRLNKQLIWRLHQERNAAIRPLVKDFPLHVERLKESLLSALRIMAIGDTVLNLQGVYLTSAVQIPAETKVLNNLFDVSTSLQTTQLTRHTPFTRSKSYFIRQLLLRALPIVTRKQPARLGHWKDKPFLYAIITGLIVLMLALTAGNQVRSHLRAASVIKAGYAQYQQALAQSSSPSAHMQNALPLLDALQQLTHVAGKSSHERAVIAYHDALQKIILPEIKHEFGNYLAQATNKNPQGLYLALEAYLMLEDTSHYQPEVVFTALKEINPALFATTHSADLTQQLQTALHEAWQPQTLNPDLIHDARKAMLNLTPAEIAYAILQRFPGNSTDSLTIDATPAALINTSPPIPALFTVARFATVYSHEIPQAVADIAAGNWVLGTSPLPLDTAALTLQVQNLYVANYVNAWESKIANIGISKASSLAEVDNLIVNFISKNASLLQLLQTIQHETGFAPITTVSPKLAAITQLMTPALDKPNGDLANIMLALTALHNELQTILQAADPGAAAFQSATAHMDDLSAQRDAINQLFLLAEKSPAPLKNWLENMATTSWHYVLQETGHFIEKHWLAEVMAFYNTEIANRFPFTPTATTEVSLARFSQFLGSQGILAGFFQTYLQAFADNTGKNWTWKTVHHEHLPFSDLALNQLQHAAHIQHAFFADGQNQPQIRFALQPIKLSANTRNLQLNIDGQELQYHRAMPRLIKTITWPGSATRVTRVNLVADTNAALNDNSNSEWGWFRIVNKSTEKILTPKKLLLTLDVNGHQASLMLYSIGRINAFLPSNLQQFKLPEQLMV